MDRISTSGRRAIGVLAPAVAVLIAAGAACAQSAPAAGRSGYERPLAKRTRIAQVEQPKQKSHNHVSINRSDETGTYTVTIEGDDVEATINGKKVDEDRIQRDDDHIKLLDDDGNVVAEFQVGSGKQGGVWIAGDGEAAPAPGGVWEMTVPGGGQGAFAGGGLGGVAVANPPPVMLGITMGEPSESLLDHLGLEPDSAVLIDKVYEGLPADQGGMQDDDVLVEFDGQKPLTEDKVREILRGKNPGDEIKVKVVRKGSTKDLKIKLQAYDAGKLGGGSFTGQGQLFTPQEVQGLGWGASGNDAARQALEEALKNIDAIHGHDADAVREQVHKAIEEALANLHQSGGMYRLQVSPRALAGPGVVVGGQPGQVYRIPQPAAPTPPGGHGDLSRQMDELRAQLDEVQKSRDELRAQLDDIKAMLKEMRDQGHR